MENSKRITGAVEPEMHQVAFLKNEMMDEPQSLKRSSAILCTFDSWRIAVNDRSDVYNSYDRTICLCRANAMEKLRNIKMMPSPVCKRGEAMLSLFKVGQGALSGGAAEMSCSSSVTSSPVLAGFVPGMNSGKLGWRHSGDGWEIHDVYGKTVSGESGYVFLFCNDCLGLDKWLAGDLLSPLGRRNNFAYAKVTWSIEVISK